MSNNNGTSTHQKPPDELVREGQGNDVVAYVPNTAPEWIEIKGVFKIFNGNFISYPTRTEPPIFCQADGQVYAYRDHRPVCNLPFHRGEIKKGVIICSFGHGFDLRYAGSTTDTNGMHLDPFPLLTQADGTAKVAIAPVAVTGQTELIHT